MRFWRRGGLEVRVGMLGADGEKNSGGETPPERPGARCPSHFQDAATTGGVVRVGMWGADEEKNSGGETPPERPGAKTPQPL